MANRIVDVARNQDLLHAGTVDQGNYGMMPYVAYNGSSNYSVTPAEGLHGTGGFTVGGWFQMTSGDTLMSVWSASANQCWRLFVNSSTPTFYVSSTGANSFSVASVAITAGRWYFVVGRYNPSTEIAIFLNATKYANTSSIPASLFNATANFAIGGNSGGTELLTGKASMCFMSHEILPDSYINVLFQLGRTMYGI